jgi:cyclophilin family peptidyl-prolyl cis-trans isomerase/HEAT repeat protein
MTRNLRIAIAVSLAWLCVQTAAFAQSIPPGLHARIIQLEDERNLNEGELAEMLKHASPKVRERAALAIGRIGDKHGTAPLLELLQSEKDEQVRAMTAFALGEMEDAQAVPALLAFLEPGKFPIFVRARPAEALGKIASVPANVELLGKTAIEQINNLLIEQLPNPKFTLTADKKTAASLTITALMRVRSTSSIEPLAQQLNSDDADIRAQAANALARIRQPLASAVPALLEVLNDRDHNVRANAARALGASKDIRVLEPLTKLLGDKSEQVQVSAIRALAAIGDKETSAHLLLLGQVTLKQVRSGKANSSKANLLLEIASAIGNLKHPEAASFLDKLNQAFGLLSQPEIEIALAKNLGNSYTVGVEFIESRPENWRQVANAAQGLAQLDYCAIEAVNLVRYTTEKNGLSRALPEVLRTLTKLKCLETDLLLLKNLAHKDANVRATAATLLATSAKEEYLDSLIAALKQSQNDKENDAKLAILTALSKYKSETAIEAIKTVLGGSDHLIRRHAINLLKQMGAGDFSDRIGIVQTGHNKLFYQRVVARMNRKVIATIHTAKGAVTMELFPAEAPITVDSFIRLARKGYFTNLTFHRVVPNFVIQGGDPRGDGEGGPGYQIRCEVNTRSYGRGALGMALSGKDTGGSQFFITHSPQPHLDGGYTVFGQVTSGMEVVDRIVRGDLIKRIAVTER